MWIVKNVLIRNLKDLFIFESYIYHQNVPPTKNSQRADDRYYHKIKQNGGKHLHTFSQQAVHIIRKSIPMKKKQSFFHSKDVQ